MSINDIGKKMLIRYPILLNISSIFYNFISINKRKIRGTNNHINIKGAFLKRCKINIYGNNNSIQFGYKTYLEDCNILIKGDNNNIILDDLVCANQTEFHIEDDNNTIAIGKKTLLAGKAHLACIEGTCITIGQNCLFSSEIVLRTGDSHSIINDEGLRINPSKNIVIMDHVWIGHRVLINKGVYISENSIVATGAVVTKSFNDKNVIIAGNPAKVIKTNINWDINRIKKGKKDEDSMDN